MSSEQCGSSTQLSPKVASATRSSALMNSHITRRLSPPPSGALAARLVVAVASGDASGGVDEPRLGSLSGAAGGASTSASTSASAAAAAAVAAATTAAGVGGRTFSAANALAVAAAAASAFTAGAAGRALRSSMLERAKMIST